MKSTIVQYTYNVVRMEEITTKSKKDVNTPTDFIFTF